MLYILVMHNAFTLEKIVGGGQMGSRRVCQAPFEFEREVSIVFQKDRVFRYYGVVVDGMGGD